MLKIAERGTAYFLSELFVFSIQKIIFEKPVMVNKMSRQSPLHDTGADDMFILKEHVMRLYALL